MPNKKISELTAGSALVGTEVFPAVQSGATVKLNVSPIIETPGVAFGLGFNGAIDAALGANTAYFMRFVVPTAFKPNRFVFYVAASSGNVDAGLYTDDGTGLAPSTRILSTGSTACPAIGRAALVITETLLVPGVYWGAFAADNATATFTHPDNRTGRIQQIRSKTTSFPLPSSITGTGNIDNGPAFLFERR